MKSRTLTTSCLCVLALCASSISIAQSTYLSTLTKTLVLAPADQAPAPKLEKVTLINVNFGSNASIVVKASGGAQRTIVFSPNAIVKNDKTTGTLTKMAQTELNKEIHIVSQKVNGVLSVTRMWDAESYTVWVSEHQGSRNGQVKGLYPKALHLGEQIYTINDSTRFVVAGKNVGRKKLDGMTTLWVKCTVKNGVAFADVIADTSESLGVAPVGPNTRPPSNSRPNSTGTGGVAGGNGSPTEQGKKPRPNSTGGTKTSPTEKTKATNRSMTNEERAKQNAAGWKVKLTLEILDADDNPNLGEKVEPITDAVEDVANSAGIGDQRIELYGNLSMFGSTPYKIDRDDAEDHKHKKGDKIVLKENGQEFRLVKNQMLVLTGYFRDRDQLSKDDDLIDLNKSFDFYDLWVAKRTVYKVSGSKAQLIIEVEK